MLVNTQTHAFALMGPMSLNLHLFIDFFLPSYFRENIFLLS